MKLDHHPLSGHVHRARLFLNLLGVEHEAIEVDLATGAHKTPDYLGRFGQIPVLVDGERVISDSNAILLVYLAKKSGDTRWLPDTPYEAAAVQRWLSRSRRDRSRSARRRGGSSPCSAQSSPPTK